ncbi:Uncharacterised protein [Mycoplasmopsis arginini]|nr:Uncharacterised protein [Mycoplasmopsis arginini]
MLISRLVRVMVSPPEEGVCNVVPRSMTTVDPASCVTCFAVTDTPSLSTRDPADNVMDWLKVEARFSARAFSSSDNFSPEKTIFPV